MAGKNRVVDRDLGFREMMGAVRELAGGAYAKVGILADDERGGLHKKDPRTGKAEKLTVAEIAVVNEFGTEDEHVPSRSFVRSTFDKLRAELEHDAAELVAKVTIDRTMTIEQALDILGLKLATGIRNAITEGAGIPPPNAPSTARQKARGEGAAFERAVAGARPLVDTAAMLNAIAWGVVLGSVKKAHKFLTGRSK